MPSVDRECITHHYACACREARLGHLVETARRLLADIDSHQEIGDVPLSIIYAVATLRDALGHHVPLAKSPPGR